MRTIFTLSLLFLTMLSAAACRNIDPAAEGTADMRQTAVDDSATLKRAAADSSRLPRVPNPKLQEALRKELSEIDAKRDAAKRPDEIQSLIVDLNALFKVLTVTARALDKPGDFSKDIQSEIERFRQSNSRVKDDAGRIMNGLTSVYDMYAILAKMRFLGREESQSLIQNVHNATVSMFKPDIQAVSAAAVIAKSCYLLTTMVMRDIDSEGLYIEAFDQIEARYKEGNRVSSMDEDRYSNGIFRTFEVSQRWAVWMNPSNRTAISKLSNEISTKSSSAENVGQQMSIATDYLYRISLQIATETVTLTL